MALWRWCPGGEWPVMQSPLVSGDRCSRGVPCVGCTCPLVVVLRRLLQMCWLAELVLTQLRGLAVAMVGMLVCRAGRQEWEWLWRGTGASWSHLLARVGKSCFGGAGQVGWVGLRLREEAWPLPVVTMAPSRFKAWACTRSSRQQPRSPTGSLHPTDHQSLSLEHLSRLSALPIPTSTLPRHPDLLPGLHTSLLPVSPPPA